MTIIERYGTVLRCYDNGGKTCDRYTVVPPRWANEERERNSHLFNAIGANEHPFAPQGFGQHVSAMPGPHLGKRVKWAELPPDVQKFARQSFPDYAPEPTAAVRQPTKEQAAALLVFATREGGRWKAALHICWYKASYPKDGADGGHLQYLRNHFGPEWLEQVTLDEIKRIAEQE